MGFCEIYGVVESALCDENAGSVIIIVYNRSHEARIRIHP
jgi:hypothetical protein